MSLFAELKRRNVFRMGIAYVLVAWLVLQVADVVLNNIEAPAWVFQTLMLLLGIGLPVVLVFSWVYEMTPEGLRRESDVDRTGSITPSTGRKLDRLITVALALAVVVLLLDRLVLEPGREAEPAPAAAQVADGAVEAGPATGNPAAATETGVQTIAVLPFVNMSPDADNEYFSDGISEELLNVLVKVNTLHVASRTSTFAYKGKDLPVTQIASELKVDNVVEGSVRKAGNRVRITAQLIDARNDRHLWSETYERELDDIFEIQEEISNAIVDALKIALNVDEAQAMERAQRPTDNLEAYELYLQGRHLWRLRGGKTSARPSRSSRGRSSWTPSSRPPGNRWRQRPVRCRAGPPCCPGTRWTKPSSTPARRWIWIRPAPRRAPSSPNTTANTGSGRR